MRLQNEPLNPDGDPDDAGEALEDKRSYLTTADITTALNKAKVIWDKAMQRTSSSGDGREFHPWEQPLADVKLVTESVIKTSSSVAENQEITNIISRCQALIEIMMEHFTFPDRASP